MRLSNFVRAAVMLSAALLAATVVRMSDAQEKQEALAKIQISGKVDSVRAGYVQLSADTVRVTYPKQEAGKKAPANEDADLKAMKHLVAIDAKTKVEVSAVASPEYIKPGQGIRLSGKVDGAGVVAGQLGSVELFVPAQYFKPTIDVGVAFSGFVDAKTEEVMPFKAQGIVFANNRGKMLVTVSNNQRLSVTLAQDAKVIIATSDYSVARGGDEITVSGRLVKPGQILGENISITLSTAPGAKKTAKPATKKEGVKTPPEKSSEKKPAEKEPEKKAE